MRAKKILFICSLDGLIISALLVCSMFVAESVKKGFFVTYIQPNIFLAALVFFGIGVLITYQEDQACKQLQDKWGYVVSISIACAFGILAYQYGLLLKHFRIPFAFIIFFCIVMSMYLLVAKNNKPSV